MKHLGLVPIRNFAVVDEAKGLYRCAQPEYGYEYEWLKAMIGLDLIINLRSESKHDASVAPLHDIKVVNICVPDHHEPTIHQALYFMSLIRSHVAQGGKVLFHCEHGHGRTSTFCVLARIATGWTLEAALKEEKDRFHYEFKHQAQVDFLKKHFSEYNKAAVAA